MTIDSTKGLGPEVSQPLYSDVVDAVAADPDSQLTELLERRDAGAFATSVSAFIAVLSKIRAGWDAVRVGTSDSFATQDHGLLNYVSNAILFRNSANSAYISIRPANVILGSAGLYVIAVTGTPEGATSAPVGSIALRTDGGASTTLYVKESGGSGNTGWVAK